MVIFPFDIIPQGAQIAIYGAGANAKSYMRQIALNNWCKVLTVVDSNYSLIQDFPQPVYPPDVLLDNTFDYILLSMSDYRVKKQIKERLLKMGISAQQIIAVSDTFAYRDEYENVQILPDDGSNEICVGFCVGEPIGDQIIFAKFYQTIMEMVGDGVADIFCDNKEITEAIFYGQPHLRNVISYYPTFQDTIKYDFFFFSAFLPRLKSYRPEKIKRLLPQLFPKIERIYSYQTNYSPGNNISVFVSRIMIDRAKFNGKNRYTLQDCNGVLEISDKKVKMTCNPKYKNSFEALDVIGPFVTFSYGASDVMKDGRPQTKIWPAEYYEILLGLIRKNFPMLKIFQVGGKDTKKIKGADKHLLGLSLEIVKYVLKDSLLHIDCESGLPHLATQLGTKCVVMFGPTPIWFFGYEENINIPPQICGECKGLVKDWYVKCIKYDRPECMYSITPEYVFSFISKFLISK